MRVHLQTTLDQYFNATTIHGFQYVQSGNHWIIRLTWVTLLKPNYTILSNFKILFLLLQAAKHFYWTNYLWLHYPLCNLGLE